MAESLKEKELKEEIEALKLKNTELAGSLEKANESLAEKTAEITALKAAGGEVNKDVAPILTENSQLKAKLAELEGLLRTRAAKKGALVVANPIKENGKTYKIGEVYTGENGRKHLDSGALKLQD